MNKHRCYENPVSGKVVALRCKGGEGKSEQDAKAEEPAPAGEEVLARGVGDGEQREERKACSEKEQEDEGDEPGLCMNHFLTRIKDHASDSH